MIISKKTDAYWLLAIITILVMAVSVITFAPGVVKAEGEPASETATFTLEGTKEQQSDGEYYPYLIISGYDKAKYSSATITVQKYEGSSWTDIGSKTYSSGITGSVKIGDSDITGIIFNTYFRVMITSGANTDYSNVAIIENQNAGAGSGDSGSGSGGGSSSGSGSSSSGSGSSSGSSSSASGSGNSSSSSTLEDKQATCPHNRGWVSAGEDGSLKCYLCGFVCDHKANTNTEKKDEKWESEYEQGHKHKYKIICSVCKRKEIEFEDPIEPHDFTGGTPEYAGDIVRACHRKTCKKCGYNILEDCEFEAKKAAYSKDSSSPDAAAKGHDATKVCRICGHEEKVTQEEHTLVNGKCTICGWKKVTPGKLSGVKVKVKSKKTSKKTFTSKGHFDNLGRWIPSKTTHSSFKICKVKISFKKPKNGYQYKIEKRPGSGTTKSDSWITKKTSGTYEMWFTSGTKKVTIKITPYSKEGVKGKTITKKIKI